METSSAVMIADVVKKDVVYSAECFDSKPLDSNTQLIVEYSVMALEAKYAPGEIAPGDWHDVERKIDGTIDIINGSLKIASVAFPPAAPVLLAIAAVGKFFQSLLKLIPDNRPDPVVVKFRELETAFHELEQSMKKHFDDMQSFLTEHNFDVSIATGASSLMSSMMDCLKYQTEEEKKRFEEEYENNYPLSAVYYMKSLLDNPQTNPLVMAMAGEKSKTKATFNKWQSIVFGILQQYLIIETFASGLFDQSEYNQEKIITQWQEMMKTFDKLGQEYKKDEGYWTELKNDFEQYFESHTNLTNAQKAQEIKERLHKCLTNDAFFICVFNESALDRDYSYYCYNKNDQFIGAWKNGRCNAFVYRSKGSRKQKKEDYDKVVQDFFDCASVLRWKNTLKNLLREELVRAIYSQFGFFALVDAQCDAQICHVNDENVWISRGTGPGHYQKVMLMHQDGINKYKEFWFMTAFH